MVDENVEKEKVNRIKRSGFFYFEVLHLLYSPAVRFAEFCFVLIWMMILPV